MTKNLLTSLLFVFLNSLVIGQGIFDASIHTAVPFGIVDSPANESAQQVIDQDPQTKFLDFDEADGIGFEVDLLGVSFVATSIEIVTANDAPERDPTNYQIWGSTDGANYDSITSGEIPCVDDRFLARTISFENTIEHSHYRLVFTGVCSPSSINQIADVQLYTAIGNAPNFTCPTDITIDNDLGLCSAAFDYEISVEDIEDESLTATFEAGFLSGEMFPVGSTTVIWSAEDSDGNKSSCSFTVTVQDIESPVCPPDIVVNIPTDETSTVVEFDFSMSDNCTVIDTLPNFIPLVTLEGESYYLSNTFFFPEDAFFDAVGNNGWLGTIRNEGYNTTINTAIRRLVGNFEVLLGFNDLNQEGSFVWQNQDPSAYNNWQENEPNDANNNEDYTIMKPNGEWNDVSGTDNQFPYLFQKTYTPIQTEGLASGEAFPLGTTTNSYQFMDIYGNVSTCTFDVVVQTSTNTNDKELSKNISISPNPTSGLLTIDNKSKENIIHLEVYNAVGRIIKTYHTSKGVPIQSFDISDLPIGTYLLRLANKNGVAMKKVMKM